jgi:hypothetical protein
MTRLLAIAIILVLSGCVPLVAKAEPQSTANIPAKVEGVVMDHLPWDDTIPVEQRATKTDLFQIVILVDGKESVYPVNVETWARSEIGQQIQLDCTALPCAMVQGE